MNHSWPQPTHRASSQENQALLPSWLRV